jgi:Protein of unknown function (DUF3300)
MNLRGPRSGFPRQALCGVIAMVCVASLPWNSPLVLAQEVPQAQSQETTTTEEAPKIPNDQLDSLVAPIALYPDAMLAQTLAASTYPLEVMQLDQWMDKNKNLKDKALADAVAKQPWDPSVQSMAAFPDVVQRMAENIQWMTDVGNAFLAQQKDVMDAVQRMRVKAQGTGNLKTGSEQKVETKTSQSGQQVIVVEQANPEAVYVPSYDPAVVYGTAPAEYPYYPYSYPGYQPGRALAWGSAIAVGGVWANNNWGNCNWDDGNVNINNNNNFNKNYNKNVNKGTGAGQGNGWQHNPQHRGNAPYANKQTANKYGGKTAGGAGKPGGPGGAGGVGGAGKPGGLGGAGGVGGAGKPGGLGGAGGVGGAGKPGGPGGAGGVGGAGKPGGLGGAGGVGGAGKPGGAGGAGKAAGGSAGKASVGGGKGGADRVGGHKPSSGGGGGAFAGGSGGSAKAASSRGGSSMKGGGGGGGSRGGGGGGKGGGGGARGGGGGKKGGGGGRGR